jgi:hypothetical protein
MVRHTFPPDGEKGGWRGLKEETQSQLFLPAGTFDAVVSQT